MKLLLSLSLVMFLSIACSSTDKKANDKSEEAKQSKEEKAEESNNVRLTECKSNSDIRSIEIKESESEGDAFEVIYTKFGDANSIASGSREHCEKIRDRVKKNLENAGFTCS